ncbi:MAG TPA: hypothetical protein VFU90_13595, partial [Candidatus Tumulicola sp.]|nr:hypothetical protein [Candidatus Tumulicola sp.]
MHAHRPTGWLRPLLTLAALAGVLSLAACGGGGGSPNNPYQPGGAAPSVAPATANIYSQIPYVFTVTGGTPPYRITSGNPNDLQVPAEAVGNTFAVLGNVVPAATTESLTVTDALGRAATATVTINPAVLLPTSITITGNPNCAASGATLCSGQDGTASVKATGANGIPLAGRAIRFDVVQGDYTISPPGQSPTTSFTVTTDQNGVAAVRLLVAVSAPTQIATIRATDVASGESIVGQFTIAQYTNGSATLTVLPTGTTTFTGPDTATCDAGGMASFYIFGGTPPYTVATNFPQAITIKGAPVLKSGGSFTITTTGVCTSKDGVTLIITDASGRVATSPTVDNVVGTAAAPPPALVVTPASLSGTCSAGSTFTFLATGGTGTYTNSINPQPAGVTVTPTGANVAVSFSSAVSATTFNITVSSGSQAV